MKRNLFISVTIMMSVLACWYTKNVRLSTPENTLKIYYEGYKRADFEYQRMTLVPWNQSIGKKRFDIVRPILQGYQILEIREGEDKEDTFHFPKGDVEALVKEIYKDNKESLNSFVLRKFDSNWLIVDWVTEDSVDKGEGDGK